MQPTLYDEPSTVPVSPEDNDLPLAASQPIEAPPAPGAAVTVLRTEPEDRMTRYLAAGKLLGKVALVAGGHRGVGRAVALGLAKEGADVAIAYLDAHEDAEVTADLVRALGRHSEAFPVDLGEPMHAQAVVEQVMDHFGRLDILVNLADGPGEPSAHADFLDVTNDQLANTFRSGVFAAMYLTRSALPYLPHGARIINTASVSSYRGDPGMIDQSAAHGAVVGFTRALAAHLAPRGILVNAVAPGPVWPPSTSLPMSPEQVARWGQDVPLMRAGKPDEIAAAFVFLASDDASYITGQTLHPNGGLPVGG